MNPQSKTQEVVTIQLSKSQHKLLAWALLSPGWPRGVQLVESSTHYTMNIPVRNFDERLSEVWGLVHFARHFNWPHRTVDSLIHKFQTLAAKVEKRS